MSETLDGTDMKPVGRSYLGNDWEISSSSDFSYLKFKCGIDNCHVELPEPPIGTAYYLTSIEYSVRNSADEAARFLERTTFGPTLTEISNLQGSNEVDYIWDQIRQKPATSHREYWRSKIAAISSTTSTAAKLFGNPCHADARYRSFAFVRDDYERYVQFVTKSTAWGKQTEVRVGPNFAGEYLLRTVVPNVTIADANDGWGKPDRGFFVPDGT